MKIELCHVDEVRPNLHRPCEICEQEREQIGAVLVVKQIAGEEPQVDFLICDVCAAKIAIAVTRRHLELEQRINREIEAQKRAPPPLPKANGRGGS